MAILATGLSAALADNFALLSGTTGTSGGDASNVSQLTMVNSQVGSACLITLNGSGLTASGGVIIAGVISSITIAGPAGSPVIMKLVFSSPVSAVAYYQAMVLNDGPSYDLIFGQQPYVFVGSAVTDTFTSGDLSDTLGGGAGDDRLSGGGGNDSLSGGAGEDVLAGEDDNDTVDGGAGDDIVYGGLGNDRLLGGAGGDVVAGGFGDDTIDGGGGDDTVIEVLGANSIVGGAGNDTIYGGGETDTISGGDGDDWISAANGNDSIDGGKGNDRILTGFGNSTVSGGAGADDIVGDAAGLDIVTFATSVAAVSASLVTGLGTLGDAAGDTYTNIDALIGSAFNDTLIGGGGGKSLSGGNGNDFLEGGAGADTLDGGGGIDTVSYATALEVAPSTGVAVDLNIVGAQAGNGGEENGDVLSNFEHIIGSNFGDALAGNEKANRLEGRAGDDFLNGGLGADTLIGGDGLDTASYSDSAVAVVVDLRRTTAQLGGGSVAGDVLIGIENLSGSAGSDVLIGNGAANVLSGNASDTLIGGGGADTLQAVSLQDCYASYATATARVTVNLGNSGVNTGDAKGDTYVNVENIIGSAFGDFLTGDAQTNHINGGAGNDVVVGGIGSVTDYLHGGAGRDRFVMGVNNQVVIDDFKAGAGGDYLDLRAVGINSYINVFGALFQSGSDVVCTAGGVNAVFQNTQLANFRPGNFLINL